MSEREEQINRIVITAIAQQVQIAFNRREQYGIDTVVGKPDEMSNYASIRPEYFLEKDLRIDSLDFVTLIQDIETNLGFNLNDEITAGVQTVANLVMVAQTAAR